MDILIILILLIHEQGMSFHVFLSSIYPCIQPSPSTYLPYLPIYMLCSFIHMYYNCYLWAPGRIQRVKTFWYLPSPGTSPPLAIIHLVILRWFANHPNWTLLTNVWLHLAQVSQSSRLTSPWESLHFLTFWATSLSCDPRALWWVQENCEQGFIWHYYYYGLWANFFTVFFSKLKPIPWF